MFIAIALLEFAVPYCCLEHQYNLPSITFSLHATV